MKTEMKKIFVILFLVSVSSVLWGLMARSFGDSWVSFVTCLASGVAFSLSITYFLARGIKK